MVLPATIDQYKALNYPTVVMADERDGEQWFIASHPDLPGCMSDGATEEEAIENLLDATELYLSTLAEDGIQIPLPKPLAPIMTLGTMSTIRTKHATARQLIVISGTGIRQADAVTVMASIPVRT